MLLIDDLILAPASFVLWVVRQVHEAAQKELEGDGERITAELSELHRMLENGAISEEQFDARESELLERLDRIQEQSDRLGPGGTEHNDGE